MDVHTIDYLKTITVIDPDSQHPVELAVYKDAVSGAMVGIDGSFLINTDEPIYSPYDVGCQYKEREKGA